MKRKNIFIAAALAATVGAAALAFNGTSYAEPYGGGSGYMGPGMMGGYGPGPGYGPGYMHDWMHGGYGPGYGRGYGPGWMHGGGGYSPGWMHGQGGYGRGGGYGPGWCWGNYRGYAGPAQSDQTQSGHVAPQHQTDLKLTTDDVKTRMERWLTFHRNPRLKLGDVKEKDTNTITADIVTVDNSLVQRFEVNRHTGFTRPEQGS